jgi:hypothetical protein
MPLKDVACITPSTTRTIQVSISPTFYERIYANFLAPKKFNLYFMHKKATQKFFVQKFCTKNVGEIDYSNQTNAIAKQDKQRNGSSNKSQRHKGIQYILNI